MILVKLKLGHLPQMLKSQVLQKVSKKQIKQNNSNLSDWYYALIQYIFQWQRNLMKVPILEQAGINAQPKVVYQKKTPISRELADILYPKSTEQIQASKNIIKGDIQRIKEDLQKQQPQILIKKDDFSAIRQEQIDYDKVVLQKLQKCNYDQFELAKQFKGTTKKWTDPDFDYSEIKVHDQVAKWKRPEEFIEDPHLLPNEISPNDIFQGWLNDCYFLSAVASLAQKDYRIHNIFSTQIYNKNGYYICKLFFDGVYQEVIVDDLFPVTSDNRPIYAQVSQKKYIWVMVLEKCWAKLLKGYSKCNYGYTAEAFRALTGAPTESYLLDQYRTASDPKCLALFNKLKQADEKGYCIEVTVDSQADQQKWMMEYGLPAGHAYSLLGVYQVKLKNGEFVKLMQVRNPWGNQQSKLLWNDKDPKWEQVSPEQRERIQFRYNKHDFDGVFYMDWQTFIVNFNHLFSVCQVNDYSNYVYSELAIKDRTPVYMQVQTDGKPDYLAISLAQPMQEHFKEDNSIEYACISIVVSKQGHDANNVVTYQFIGQYNYYNQIVDNYYNLPLRKFAKGKYMLRIYGYWSKPCTNVTPCVVGLYSPAAIGLKVNLVVNDEEFIQQNCIYQAKHSNNRSMIVGDPASWICKEILPDSNLGFLVFYVSKNSPHNGYHLKFSETKNKDIYFLLDHKNLKEFIMECQKGYMYVIVYAFLVENTIRMDKKLYPNFNPGYIAPNPLIIPY